MRERMVTRTINEVKANTVVYDVAKSEMKVVDFILTGKLNNEEALKALKNTYETDTFKVVNVNAVNVTEQLYGMAEDEFIRVAKKIDKRYATK